MGEEEGTRTTNMWTARIAVFQEMTNDSARFLAAFDIRKAQNSLTALSDSVGVARAAIMPRKKFAFSRKAPPLAGTTTTTTTMVDDTTMKVAEAATTSKLVPGPRTDFEEDEYTIEDLTGKTVIIESGTFAAEGAAAVIRLEAELAAVMITTPTPPTALVASLRRARALAGGRDVRIQRCTDCTFILLDVLRAVRADSLVRCRVVTSAVAGSLLLHGATDCTFLVAARQFRLHTSTRCDFFIRTRSHPIIEDCSVFRFAPYPCVGTQLDADLADSDLGPRAASSSLWKAVDDFKWHRAQHSPNWREMTGEERQGLKVTMLPIQALERGITVDETLLLEGTGGAAAAAAAEVVVVTDDVPIVQANVPTLVISAAADDEL